MWCNHQLLNRQRSLDPTAKGAKQERAYSDAYKNKVKQLKKEIKDISKIENEKRLRSVQKEAEEKIDKKEKKFKKERKKAYKKLDQAEKKAKEVQTKDQRFQSKISEKQERDL